MLKLRDKEIPPKKVHMLLHCGRYFYVALTSARRPGGGKMLTMRRNFSMQAASMLGSFLKRQETKREKELKVNLCFAHAAERCTLALGG